MGLDITAVENAVLKFDNSDPDADHYPLIRVYMNTDFPSQFDELKEGWYETANEEISFRAGSYSGYNTYRSHLCKMAHGMTDRLLFADQTAIESFVDGHKPFSEQIYFSDCEGAIGPKTCAKLYQDYVEHEAKAAAYAAALNTEDEGFQYGSYWLNLYDLWKTAFKKGANNGFVDFS